MAPKILSTFGWLILRPRNRPMTAFAAFSIVSVASYLPMHLVFGDGAWFEPGHYPFPVQTSRILLYPAYFFSGVGIGVVGLRAGSSRRMARSQNAGRLGSVCGVVLGAILLLVYAHHNWIENFASPALWWRTAYGVAFAIFSTAMAFTVPSTSLRLSRSSLCGFSRRDAAVRLRHLSPALHVHHLAAICRLRPRLARRRQGGDRVRRHARCELAAHGVAAKFRSWRG